MASEERPHDVLHDMMEMSHSVMDALSHSALVGDADGRVKRHGTVLGSTATLANCAIGAGVLAMPYAVSELGYVLGGGVVFTAALLVVFTLIVLVRAGSTFGSSSYQGLVHDAFGGKVAQSVSAVLIVYLFGSCVAYLIIIGDSYTKVMSAVAASSDAAWWASRRFAIAVIAAVVVTPLSLLREMSRLAPASAIALFALAYTALAIVTKGIEKSAGDAAQAVAVKFDVGSISAVPIVVFAFQCHIQVLAIFAELSANGVSEQNDPLDEPHERELEERRILRMFTVIAYAVGICFFGYLAVGEFAYMSHPDVSSNVLDSYDKSDKAMLIATILMGCSAVASFPVNHHAARAALDDLLASAFGWDRCAPGQAPARRHVSQTFGFVFTATMVSFMVKDLGKVFELIGATCGSLVMFIIPAALLLHPRMRSTKTASTSGPLDDLEGLDDVTRELLSSARDLLERDFAEGEDGLNLDDRDVESADAPTRGTIFVVAVLCLIAAFVATSNVYVILFVNR